MRVPESIKRLFKEVDDYIALTDATLAKLKCELKHGERIYWYYQEDLDFAKEERLKIRQMKYYSGLVIGLEDSEPGALDPDSCMIVIDRYPVEKCNPEITWVAPSALLAAEDLVEVYQLTK